MNRAILLLLLGIVFNLTTTTTLKSQAECPTDGGPFCFTEETGTIGGTTCVSAIANGYEAVTGFQFTLTFDPAVVTYTDVQNVQPGLGDLEDGINTSFTDEGILVFAYFSAEPLSLEDGATVFELCFSGLAPGFTAVDVTDTIVGEAIFVNDLLEEDDISGTNGGITILACEDTTVMLDTTICIGEVFEFNGLLYTSPQIIEATFPTPEGCDSTVIIDLSLSIIEFELPASDTVCPGDQAIISVPDTLRIGFPGGPYASGISLAGGEFTLEIISEQGCTVQNDIIIGEHAVIPAAIEGATAFCPEEESTIITATPEGQQYEWEDGSTNPTREVGAGDYSVTVTDENGCTSSASITIEAFLPPFVVIQGDSTYCSNDEGTVLTVLAEGVEPLSIEWSTGSDDQMIIATEGAISVTVTDANGCTTVEEVIITEFNAPQGSIEGESAFCPDEGGVLLTVVIEPDTGTPPFTFDWDNGADTDTTTVGEGIFTVFVTDDNGCTLVLEAEVEAFDVIPAEIEAPAEICEGSLTPIAAFPIGQSYEWENGDTTRVRSVGPGNYAVTVTDQNGCTTSAEVTIESFPLPTVEIIGDVTYCSEDEFVTLTAEAMGAEPLVYEWSTGSVNPTINTPAGLVSVTVTDANGCEAIAELTVIEFSSPTISVSGDFTFCADEEGTLLTATTEPETGTPPFQFTWSNGATTDTTTVSGGPISVSVTDANGCESSASFVVAENPIPLVEIIGETTYCQETEGTFVTAVAEGNGPFTFSWSNEATDGTVLLTEGTYQVTATDFNGCTAVAEVEITELPLPFITLTGDTTVCANEEGTLLTASVGNPVQPLFFSWSTGATTPSIVAPPGVYGVTVTDGNGCINSLTGISVSESPTPELEIIGEDRYCFGTEGTILTAVGASGTPPFTFVWSTEEETESILVTEGFYEVTLTDANGCTATTGIEVTELPPVVAEISGDTLICDDLGNVLTASGGTIFDWSTGETTESITVTDAGLYTVIVSNDDGCSTTAEIIVVNDAEPPVFVYCPPDITLTANFGETGRIATWLNPIVEDNCQVTSIGASNMSGDFFPIGTTIVSIEAEDAEDNLSECTFTVNVVESNELTLYIDTIDITVLGDTTCVDIRAKRFDDILGYQFTVTYPAGSYLGSIANDVFANDNGVSGFTTFEANDSSLAVIYTNPEQLGVSLAEDEIVMTLKLILPGEPGDCSFIDINGSIAAVEAFQQGTGGIIPTVIGGEVCKPNNITITGRVIRPDDNNTPVPLTEVRLIGSDPELIDITNAAGNYGFTDVPAGQDYELLPERDFNDRNGLSIIDLILIQAHIEVRDQPNNPRYFNPYQFIAADVTQNTDISGTDIFQIRQLIIQQIDAFPQTTSWRFVPTEYVFPNPQLPLANPIPTSILLPALANDATADFFGIKMGDVNFSANVATLTDDDGGVSTLQVAGPSELEAGSTVTIEVGYAQGAASAVGFQANWQFDPRVLSLVDVKGSDNPGVTADFNTQWQEKGELPSILYHTVADGHTPLPTGQALLRFTFHVKQSASLAEVFRLDPGASLVAPQAVNRQFQAMQLHTELTENSLATSAGANLIENSQPAELTWLEISPNPSRGDLNVRFSAVDGKAYIYEVYDLQGQQLLRGKLHHQSDQPAALILPANELPTVGTYLLRISGVGDQQRSLAKKFIRQ
ncbi:MAG: cohesin domain-containing protein [Bacteroidota bacterium]